MRSHRAALLRQTGLIEHAGTLALQMSGHAEQGADGDHAGATNTGNQDVPWLIEGAAHARRRPLAHQAQRVDTLALAPRCVVHGDEARAKPIDATVILIAIVLIAFSFAAVIGFFGPPRPQTTFL